MSASSVTDAWLWQAHACETMGAPFTAAVLRCMVEDEEARVALRSVLESLEKRSARDLVMAAYPLRLLGGFHLIALKGLQPQLTGRYARGEMQGLAPLIADATRRHSQVLAGFLASPPQTNEVRRSLALVGGFLVVAQETGLPLRCLELGASAGLNMNWDRYAYDFGEGRRWGEADSPLSLSGDWSGGAPPLNAKVEVVEKRACDQSPIDVRSDEGALRLQAYIWPEQTDRLGRVRTAIALARQTGIQVDKADAVEWAKANIKPQKGAATVVYHSSFIQYPPPDVQAAIIDAIKTAGESASQDAPLAWLRKEPTGQSAVQDELRLTLWPGGEDRLLADAHPHGAAINWRA